MSAYQGNNTTTRGDYGRSAVLWEGVNWSQLRDDPSYGHGVIERFSPYRSGDYTVTQATAGTQTQYAAAYGGVVLDSGATTANQGVNVQNKTPFLPQTNGVLVYETLGFFSANSTGPQFFCGLHEDDTTILTTSGALTSDELVGFHSISGNTLLAKNQATGTIQSQAAGSLSTTAGTLIRLGFKIFRRSKIEFYVNGELLATTPTSQIPASAMLYPSVVCRSNGTTQPTFTQHWWACAAIFQSDY
jgi:hypothetical protein